MKIKQFLSFPLPHFLPGERGDGNPRERGKDGGSRGPTTNGGMQNESSVGTRTRRMHVICMFRTDFYAQSVLIKKVSASELSGKFIKSALLVGEGEEKSIKFQQMVDQPVSPPSPHIFLLVLISRS